MADLVFTYRQVGTTELQIPAFGLGTAHLRELYTPVAEADSRATLQAAWDGGVPFYDTALWYGRGLSGHRVGGFLRTKPRDDFVLTTKVGRMLHRPFNPKTFDRSPWKGTQNLASLAAPIPTAFWADLKAQRLIEPGALVPAGH